MPLLWLLLLEEQQWLSAAHLGAPRCAFAILLTQTHTYIQRESGETSAFMHSISLLGYWWSELPSVSLTPGCPSGGWTRLKTHCSCCWRKCACWSSYTNKQSRPLLLLALFQRWKILESGNEDWQKLHNMRHAVLRNDFLLQQSLGLCKTCVTFMLFLVRNNNNSRLLKSRLYTADEYMVVEL